MIKIYFAKNYLHIIIDDEKKVGVIIEILEKYFRCIREIFFNFNEKKGKPVRNHKKRILKDSNYKLIRKNWRNLMIFYYYHQINIFLETFKCFHFFEKEIIFFV